MTAVTADAVTPTTTGPYFLLDHSISGMAPGLWLLQQGNPGAPDRRPIKVFNQHKTSGTVRGALIIAADALREEGEHVTRWHESRGGAAFQAMTGPFLNRWQVTRYRGRDGRVWNRTLSPRAGLAVGGFECDGQWYETEADLDRSEGPLGVIAVDALHALVEELRIYRARATYLHGPMDCFEDECDELYDGDDRRNDLERCSHVEERIASKKDAIGMAAILDLLADFEKEAKLADAHPDRRTAGDKAELAGVTRVVEAIRHALSEIE